jgi:DNA gyrase/topoisomerase IV subunit A
MKTINRSVSDVIDTEYREYAMYVLESRAIPSVIDGMKMVHRKLVYSMLNEYAGKKVKLADLSGISKLGYHHGETSAASAAVTITADWNNNCPIFTGHGNFGSRLVTDAAAPRYIFATISPDFKKFFVDTEIVPKSLDEESPEPQYYLPIIPWVLVNGLEGIAVGFKCSILPRSIKDITDATRAYLKNQTKFIEANEPIKPTFPHFRGEVIQHSVNQWKTRGIISYIGKNFFEISELPIGYDRETYVTFLNDLCDKDLIKDYEDSCSKNGFGFKIKVSLAQKEAIEKDPFKYFKLEKIHTEILTTLGSDGKLKIFQSVAELIAYFCDFRLTMFRIKIEYDKAEVKKDIERLFYKRKFVNSVVNNDIDLKKTSKQQLLDFIENKISPEEWAKSLIRIPLYEITIDEIAKISSSIIDKKTQLTDLELLTPEKLFNSRLASIRA